MSEVPAESTDELVATDDEAGEGRGEGDLPGEREPPSPGPPLDWTGADLGHR